MFTSELKSHYIVYLYRLILDLKQCDIVEPPYLNAQISGSSGLEEDVQSPQNLIESDNKLYRFVENNKQDVKFKHLAQLYTNYW